MVSMYSTPTFIPHDFLLFISGPSAWVMRPKLMVSLRLSLPRAEAQGCILRILGYVRAADKDEWR